MKKFDFNRVSDIEESNEHAARLLAEEASAPMEACDDEAITSFENYVDRAQYESDCGRMSQSCFEEYIGGR
jgi:hypothetical protein